MLSVAKWIAGRLSMEGTGQKQMNYNEKHDDNLQSTEVVW